MPQLNPSEFNPPPARRRPGTIWALVVGAVVAFVVVSHLVGAH